MTVPGESADLKGFLEAAGRSLVEAQGSLAGDAGDVPSKVAISDAELEVRALVETTSGGTLSIKPVSSQDAIAGRIAPGALSTFKIRYVAIVDEVPPAASTSPRRSADDVIREVKSRPDVASLHRVLGGLRFEATFVPPTKRWLVTATDPAGRVVREAVLSDVQPTVKPPPS